MLTLHQLVISVLVQLHGGLTSNMACLVAVQMGCCHSGPGASRAHTAVQADAVWQGEGHFGAAIAELVSCP